MTAPYSDLAQYLQYEDITGLPNVLEHLTRQYIDPYVWYQEVSDGKDPITLDPETLAFQLNYFLTDEQKEIVDYLFTRIPSDYNLFELFRVACRLDYLPLVKYLVENKLPQIFPHFFRVKISTFQIPLSYRLDQSDLLNIMSDGLREAIHYQNSEITRYLLEKGVPVENFVRISIEEKNLPYLDYAIGTLKTPIEGWMLQKAGENGFLEGVEYLLQSHPFMVSDLRKALEEAHWKGYQEVADYLIQWLNIGEVPGV